MKLLIPMAGEGSRFKKEGFILPKPLIFVKGKHMIERVLENFSGLEISEYIFICRREHEEKFKITQVLNNITNNKARVIFVDKLTEGAACTTLLAKEFIDVPEELLIANSDQFVKWNASEFVEKARLSDGCIATFKATDKKWSFAKLDEQENVIEVAEKNPISDNATVGIYYWKSGHDYVFSAQQMIQKNIRTNNEFYVCPTYNEAILNGKKITTYNVANMYGLGTPEDLVENACYFS